VKQETSFQKKGSPVPVRLTDEEKRALESIADATGLTASTLMRLLVSALVRQWRVRGAITLPLNLRIE
jgi:antitoxin component of RelBE/YafQ-DinJ toxin-antitoxin module